MLPYFAGTGHNNYKRSLYRSLTEMSALNPAVHEELKKGSLSFAEQAHFSQKCLQTFALNKLSRTVLKVPQV